MRVCRAGCHRHLWLTKEALSAERVMLDRRIIGEHVSRMQRANFQSHIGSFVIAGMVSIALGACTSDGSTQVEGATGGGGGESDDEASTQGVTATCATS